MKPIEFNIQLDNNDLVRFNIYHFKKRTLLKVLTLSVIISVLIPILSEKDPFDNLSIYVGLVLFFNLFMLLAIIILLNRPKWDFRRTSALKEPGKIIFNEDEFIIEKKDYRSEWKYSTVKSIESYKKTLYIYVDKNIAFIFPFRFLQNQQDWLIDFLKDKTK